jgi:hypothetical protein
MGRFRLATAFVLASCGGHRDKDADDTAALASVCPPASAPDTKKGDANGDGFADMADVAWIRRAVYDEGPAPWCPELIDLIDDGRVEGDDAFQLLSFLYEGVFKLPRVEEGACDAFSPPTPGDCADPGFAWEPGENAATLHLDPGGVGVEGWSLGITAEGCTIAAATVDGTAAADRYTDDAGQRDTGYAYTLVNESGALSAVLLSLHDEVTLTGASPSILSLELGASGDGCGECTVRLSTVTGYGEPVETMVAGDGWRYVPELPDLTVEVCP